jgi:hypothetical protein
VWFRVMDDSAVKELVALVSSRIYDSANKFNELKVSYCGQNVFCSDCDITMRLCGDFRRFEERFPYGSGRVDLIERDLGVLDCAVRVALDDR